jgi:hypothetical protein
MCNYLEPSTWRVQTTMETCENFLISLQRCCVPLSFRKRTALAFIVRVETFLRKLRTIEPTDFHLFFLQLPCSAKVLVFSVYAKVLDLMFAHGLHVNASALA